MMRAHPDKLETLLSNQVGMRPSALSNLLQKAHGMERFNKNPLHLGAFRAAAKGLISAFVEIPLKTKRPICVRMHLETGKCFDIFS